MAEAKGMCVLPGVVDSLAKCPIEGRDVLVAGCSNFWGPRWTGSFALLASDGNGVSLLASTGELAAGVPAVAALPQRCQYTRRLILASGGDDGSVSLWEGSAAAESADLRHTHTKASHDNVVSGLAAGSSNSQLASCSWDGCVRLWDCEQHLVCTSLLTGHYGAAHAVVWEQAGSLVMSAGQDGTVKVWDPRSASSLACSLVVGAPVFALAQLAQQPNLMLAGDQLGRLVALDWRAASGSGSGGSSSSAVLLSAKLHSDVVRSIAFHGHSGKAGGSSGLDVAVGGDDGRVLLVDPKEIAGGALSTVKVAFSAQASPPLYVRALCWGAHGLYRGSWDATVAPVPV